MPREYSVSEGNKIGGQEPQALGAAQARITASAEVVKGQVLEMTGDWTVGPCGTGSLKYAGIAMNDAKIGERVVIDTEGFMKIDVDDAVVAGDKLVCGAAGKARKFVVANDKVDMIIGRVFVAADAGGVAYAKMIG